MWVSSNHTAASWLILHNMWADTLEIASHECLQLFTSTYKMTTLLFACRRSEVRAVTLSRVKIPSQRFKKVNGT